MNFAAKELLHFPMMFYRTGTDETFWPTVSFVSSRFEDVFFSPLAPASKTMATFLLPSGPTPSGPVVPLAPPAHGGQAPVPRTLGCQALGLCLTLTVASRQRRASRVARMAQRPINARDRKTIPQGGSWLFPSVDDDELYEEMENELPPKKALEDSVYCCWAAWIFNAARRCKNQLCRFGS